MASRLREYSVEMRTDRMLVRKGAEANLYLEKWHGLEVIEKKRLPKRYRVAKLDSKIRQFRTVREARLIHDAKSAGVPTPTIYSVDLGNATIIMEHIRGARVKEALDSLDHNARKAICYRIGRLIGRLHNAGIIHGDLTTSNIIVSNSRIVLLDFGLGEHSENLEERGVDLLLMKRAFQSAHYKYSKECFGALLEGYAEEAGSEASKEVVRRLRDVERRGRYVSRKVAPEGV